MKRFFERAIISATAFFAVLGGAYHAPADEASSRPHADAIIEKARQEAREAEATKGVLTLKNLMKIVQEEQNRTSGVRNARVFENPDRDDVLKNFGNFLAQKIVPKSNGIIPPDEEVNGDQIRDLISMMRTLEAELRPAMLRVVRTAIAGDFAKRCTRLSLIHNYVNEFFVEEFRAFDKAYYAFIGLVDEMRNNGVTDVSGAEILMASGLDKYATDHMKAQPRFDKILRALDSHLVAADTPTLNKLRDDINVWDSQIDQAIKVFQQAQGKFANLAYGDKMDAVMNNYAELIAQASGVLFKISALIDEANGDSVFGKVRSCSNSLAPNGSLFVDQNSVSNGNPVYVRRVRRALEECRKYYIDAAKHINAAGSGRPNFKPMPTVWK